MKNLLLNSRLVYMTPPQETPGSMETPSDVPKADEITSEHIDNVLNAVDANIKTIEDYYKDDFTVMRNEKMPDDIQNNLNQLRELKAQLENFKNNPQASRDTLVQIYNIFSSLDEYAEKTVEEARNSHDPLQGLGIIAGIYRPKLETEQPAVAEEEGDTRMAESQEVTKEKLVLAAVENIARANGELTQPMLDALRTYKPGESPLRFDFKIEGNPVTIFVERTADGFAAVGGRTNEEQLAPDQAPTWELATFNFSHSFNAEDENRPAVPLRSAEEYVAMVKNGELPPERMA